ncbi:Putative uncharacterized protein [Lactobacillus delbrueckii subsp. lactis]|nr:Putative uncharacterized protein [Lactobacillus delbrueckii subsp. lactis]
MDSLKTVFGIDVSSRKSNVCKTGHHSKSWLVGYAKAHTKYYSINEVVV